MSDDAIWANSVEHNDARRAASIAFADQGDEPSVIRGYGGEYGDTSDGALVEFVLTKPCGTLVDHKIVLTQADPAGDLIMTGGTLTWAEWLNGDGDLVARMSATGEDGGGPLKVQGSDGALLRAGGRCRLATTAIG